MSGTIFVNVNNIQSMIHENQKNITTMYIMIEYGAAFYSHHTGT